MCFSMPKAPKPPKPAMLPLPVNPQKAVIEGEDEIIRRQKAAMAPRSSTVVTSATGDPGYGSSVGGPAAGVTRLVA